MVQEIQEILGFVQEIWQRTHKWVPMPDGYLQRAAEGGPPGPPKGAVGLLEKIHGFLGFLGPWISWIMDFLENSDFLRNLGFLGRLGHENWGFVD